jgi:hypothetical protein
VTSPIRLQIYLYLLALPLHLIWEVAQIEAYAFPETNLMKDVIGCFLPSLGDGLMTLVIYWAGWLAFRDWQWILHPGIHGYLFMMSIGLLLAVAVEWNALYQTRAWAYNERMITVPILGVGLLPILQMLLLLPATAVLVQWMWRKRRKTPVRPVKVA